MLQRDLQRQLQAQLRPQHAAQQAQQQGDEAAGMVQRAGGVSGSHPGSLLPKGLI